METRWAAALLIVAAIGVAGVLAYKRRCPARPEIFAAKVIGYRSTENTVSVDLKLSGLVERVDVLEPRPTNGIWSLGSINIVGGGECIVEGRRPERLDTSMTIELRSRLERGAPMSPPTRLVLAAELLGNKRALVWVDIDHQRCSKGVRDGVTAKASPVTEGSEHLRAALAEDVEYCSRIGRLGGEDGVARAEQLLRDLRSAGASIRPRLLSAECYAVKCSETRWLALALYDELRSITTIRIRESGSDGQTLVEEDYVVYPRARRDEAVFSQPMFQVQARGLDDRKDEQAWADYVATANGPSNDTLPTIWLSPPWEARHVEISLVDADGNETNAVPLTMRADNGSGVSYDDGKQ